MGSLLSIYLLRTLFGCAPTNTGIEKDKLQCSDLRAKATTDKDEPIGIEEARTLLGQSTQSMSSKYMRDRNGHLVAPLIGNLTVQNTKNNVEQPTNVKWIELPLLQYTNKNKALYIQGFI